MGNTIKLFYMSKLQTIGGGDARLTYLPPCVQVLDVELEQAVLTGSGSTQNLEEELFTW